MDFVKSKTSASGQCHSRVDLEGMFNRLPYFLGNT